MELETTVEDELTFTMKEATIAVKFYRRHLKRTSEYQKQNPDVRKQISKRWYEKMKVENPDKYEDHLMKQRENWHKRKQKNIDIKLPEGQPTSANYLRVSQLPEGQPTT